MGPPLYVDHYQPMKVVVATIDTRARNVVIGDNPLMTVLSQFFNNIFTLDDSQLRPASKIFHFGRHEIRLAS